MKQCKEPLFLHKEEWERLKRVRDSPREPQTTNGYIQSLIQKSQNWIKLWPDSIQGHISKLDNKKKNQRAKDLALMELFKKEQKGIFQSNDCIAKAKEIIFDDSCYGRRLISALLESKALEERDVQLEFNKEITLRAEAENNQQNIVGCSLQSAPVMEKQEKEQETRKRQKDEEIAQFNRIMYTTKSEHDKEENDKKTQMEIEDLRLLKEIIKLENAEEAHKKVVFHKELEQLIVERRKFKDEKMAREAEEERRAEIWRKFEEKREKKIKMIVKQSITQNVHSEKNYELIKKINDDRNKRYDEFVNKGMETFARKLQNKEEEDKQKQENERKKLYLSQQANKKLADAQRFSKTNLNKCVCDRQFVNSPFNNTHQPPRTSIPHDQATVKIQADQDKAQLEKQNNKSANNTSANAFSNGAVMKTRGNEPSPWSGAGAAHAQFARRAADTLRQCRYKRAARRVVDDYRRQNALTAKSLPVEHYL